MSEKRWRMRSEQLAKTGYKYAPIWRRLRCIEEIAYQDESRHIIEMKAAIMKLRHLCIPACEKGAAAQWGAKEALRHTLAAIRATTMCAIDPFKVPADGK